MEGKVKWFDHTKGFGFITGEDGQEYFVHHSEIQDDNTNLEDDEEVTFETAETPKGVQARAVKRV